MSIYGNPVMLGGSGGGGGGDVPLLTRAQWNALSTAQKQAYGLLAIQDENSGFDRGELVYGADYTPTLLIASASSSIYAEEWWEDYLSGDRWGDVVLTGSGYSKEYDAVRLPIGAMGSIALPNSNYSVTAYTVINNYTPTSGDPTLFAVPYAYGAGNQPGFFVRGGVIWRTVYGSDVSTGISSNSWHVLTLALNNDTKTCRYYIDGVAYSSAIYSNSGAIVSLSAATMYSQASLNADVAWVGVVNRAETEEVILANHANIMSKLSQYFGT